MILADMGTYNLMPFKLRSFLLYLNNDHYIDKFRFDEEYRVIA